MIRSRSPLQKKEAIKRGRLAFLLAQVEISFPFWLQRPAFHTCSHIEEDILRHGPITNIWNLSKERKIGSLKQLVSNTRKDKLRSLRYIYINYKNSLLILKFRIRRQRVLDLHQFVVIDTKKDDARNNYKSYFSLSRVLYQKSSEKNNKVSADTRAALSQYISSRLRCRLAHDHDRGQYQDVNPIINCYDTAYILGNLFTTASYDRRSQHSSNSTVACILADETLAFGEVSAFYNIKATNPELDYDFQVADVFWYRNLSTIANRRDKRFPASFFHQVEVPPDPQHEWNKTMKARLVTLDEIVPANIGLGKTYFWNTRIVIPLAKNSDAFS